MNTTIEQKAKEEAKYEISTKLDVAFDNLVMAAQAKEEIIDSMTKDISVLTESVARLTRKNEELVKEIKKFKAGGGSNSNRTNKPGGEVDKDGWKLNGYCWTCGYKVKGSHHSVTCRFKDNPGHQKGATRANPMGGSTLNAGFDNKPNGKERE